MYDLLSRENSRRTADVIRLQALQRLVDMPEDEFKKLFDEYTKPFRDMKKHVTDEEMDDANMILRARDLRLINRQEAGVKKKALGRAA